MPCTPNCGACCDPVGLGDATVQRAFAFGPASPQMEWIWDNWQPMDQDAADGWVLQCINYDPAKRACLAYDTRPPVCRDFPFYGRETILDGKAGATSNVCGYQAEAGRTVLPLIVL